MADKRKIEIFSAGCALCLEAIKAVELEAGASFEVIVHDMREKRVLERPNTLVFDLFRPSAGWRLVASTVALILRCRNATGGNSDD
jgi:hypothetical protein